jgi:hypothetical protein
VRARAQPDVDDKDAASVTGRAEQDRRSQALSAADSAERVLPCFEEAFPNDDRPRQAIEAARAWARGEIRVGEARAAALAAHAAAREAIAGPANGCTVARRAASAAARAAGHAAATAHVITHARGVTFYVDKVLAYANLEQSGDTNPVSASGPQ